MDLIEKANWLLDEGPKFPGKNVKITSKILKGVLDKTTNGYSSEENDDGDFRILLKDKLIGIIKKDGSVRAKRPTSKNILNKISKAAYKAAEDEVK